MLEEEWRLYGYGYYVTQTGRVLSDNHTSVPYELKVDPHGYVYLTIEGKQKRTNVQKMIKIAFSRPKNDALPKTWYNDKTETYWERWWASRTNPTLEPYLRKKELERRKQVADELARKQALYEGLVEEFWWIDNDMYHEYASQFHEGALPEYS